MSRIRRQCAARLLQTRCHFCHENRSYAYCSRLHSPLFDRWLLRFKLIGHRYRATGIFVLIRGLAQGIFTTTGWAGLHKWEMHRVDAIGIGPIFAEFAQLFATLLCF